MKMKRNVLSGFATFVASVFLATTFAQISQLEQARAGHSADPFPHGPRSERTPGSVCQTGNTFRYPEKIRYCERHVEPALKYEIIRAYDREFGYSIHLMPRVKFKIDHYIPLCAGGSNQADNLWPQHESVYKITDPLEQLVCEKMAAGVLKQADAIALIREAKNNLAIVEVIITRVEAL